MSFTASGYPHLSYSQLEQVWIQAGGPRGVAPLMAAIAMAESGGWAGATNPTDNGGTQTSWGLWQVSDGTHGWSYGGNPYNPADNAKAAVAKYRGQGLSAWGTYTSGAYQQFMRGNVPPGTGTIPGGSGGGGPHAVETGLSWGSILDPIGFGSSLGSDVTGLGSVVTSIFKGGISSATSAFSAIGAALGAIAKIFEAMLWLFNPANWLRIVSGFFGAILFFIALYLLATT